MKKRLLSILMFLAFATVTNAQSFYNSCIEAAQNIDCSTGLNGQMGTFPVSNQGGQPSGDCNMTVHNGVWISFVAGTPNITIEIAALTCDPPPGGWAGNCSTPGVQTALYSGCGPNYVLEQCGPGAGASNTPPNTTNNFFLTGLTVGGVYHLLLDGNCNAICDFAVNTVAGSTTPQPLSGSPSLAPNYDVCAGGTITISTTPVTNAGDYTWTLPDGTVLTGQGPSISYTPGAFGPISVTAGNGCDVTAPAFSVITEYVPPVIMIDETDRCLEGPVFTYGTFIGHKSPLNTNMIETIQTTTTDANGCTQDVTIMLQYIDPPTENESETICFGSVSQYGNYTTSGIYTVPGTTPEGCSKTTILDLTVVNPIAAINPGTSTTEINCLPPMTATLTAVPHAGQPGSLVTYDWDGPGNIIGDGTQQVFVDAGGTYTLTVTEIVNLPPTQANPLGQQLICTSQFPSSIMVTESTGPPTATVVQNATIDCNSGSVQLDGSGSSEDGGTCFAYSWTDPNGMQVSTELSPTIANAIPGNYSLTVFNNCNNCFAMAPPVNVTGATASQAMATSDITTVDCNNTMATLDANGSSPNATYTWTDANGMVVGTGITLQVGAGEYTLTVDNGSGCNASANPITISSNNATPTANITGNAPINCNTTSVTLDGTGSTGSGTLTYSWQDANGMVLSTDPTYNTMNTGQVNLVVTDSGNGCSSTNPASVNVTNNSPTITFDITPTGNISCTSASMTLEATNISGATNPTFVWTDANGMQVGTSNPLTVNAEGTYTVVVTDSGTGCSEDDSQVVVGDTNTPTAIATSSNDLDCNITTTTLDASNSTTGTDITYEWFDANGMSVGTGISISVSTPGDYNVVVTNTTNGCNIPSTSVNVAENNDTPTAMITGNPNIDCNNTSVTLDGTGSTGSGTLTYSWQDANGMVLSTDPTYNTMTPGQVNLVVTDSGNGCSSVNPASETVVDNSATVTFDITPTGNISCTSTSMTLEATSISGATNPTFVWTDANGMQVGTTNPLTVNTAGTYTVVVTDGVTGCFGDDSQVVVGNTDAPMAMASSSNDIDCNNTTTTLSASGSSTGTNFTYEWFNAAGTSVGTGISITVADAGDYNVVVTNTDNDCNTPSTSITVASDNNTPTAVISGNDALDCNNNGSITLDGSGSTTTGSNTITSYEWLDASGAVVGVMSTLAVNNPGDYTLNIIQSNGCASPAETVTVIDNTTTVSVEATVSGMITCEDVTVMLDAVNPQGATNPTYEWFDATGASVGTGPSYSANAAGDYTVEITDPLSGCNNTAVAIVGENIIQPTISAVVANNQPLTCDITSVSLDGSASATGSNIEYTWTNAAGASVGDVALVNVSTAGTYTLEILDTSNGCTNTATVTVTEETADPIADAGAGGTLDCGQASFVLDGGASTTGANISYEWFNASGSSVGTGITFSAASEGDYTLVVTNTDTGCDSEATASVVASTDVPNVGTSATNNGLLTCDFDMLTLTGTSTTPGVTMEWQDASGAVVSSTATLEVSTVGTYTFVVVDPSNGCPASQPVNVTDDILAPTADAGVDPTLTCNDNFVTLNGSGSTAGNNIQYEWFDAAGASVGTGVTVDVMTAGDYTLVVTNTDNGCNSTPDVVEVMQDADIPVVVAINTNLDCDNTTASLDGTGSSTGADIEYAWINTAGATVSTDLVAPVTDPGMYQLMITNTSNGCNTTSTFLEVLEDTQVPTLTAANTTGQLTCTTLAATLDGTGSSTGAEFEYAWMDDMGTVLSTDISFDVNDPGTYSFQVTNTTNGCSDINTTVIVTQDIEAPMAEVAGNATLTCVQNQATLDGTGSSVGMNFSYAWTDDNGILVGTDLITPVMNAGVYTLTVTNDDTGCETISASTVEILQDANVPVAVINSDPTANVLNCDNGSVMLDASGSTPVGSLTYEWLDEMGNVLGTDATIVVSDPGTVTLNIIDTNNSCDDSELFLIVEDTNAPTALIANPTTLDCDNPVSTLDGGMSSTGANITYQWLDVNGDIVGTDVTLDTSVPGDYTFVVTNTDNGCDASMPVSLGDNFEAPAVDPGVGSTITCLDGTATLDGSGSASSATITYQWTDATGMVVSSDPTNPNLDVTIPGDYILTAFDSSNGCETTSAAITILENVDLPQAEAGMPQTITCTNDVLTLSGTGSDSGPDITYSWTDPAGNEVGTEVLLTNVTTDGTYTLEVTNATTGCVNTDDVVIDLDVQAPTADAGNGGVLTCGTASFTLDASANSSMGTDFTYQWLDANGVVVGTDVDFDAGAAGDYTFVVTDMTNGCTDQDLVSVMEDLNSPQFDVMLSNDLLTCATQMITLDASNSSVNANSSGTLEFAWESPTGASLGTTNTIDVSESGTYTLTITDDANGCFATQPIIVGQDVEAPMAAIQAPANATLVCGQDDLLLDASSSTTGSTTGDLEYTWFDEAGVEVGTGITFAATSAQTYTVEVLNTSNGCTNQTTQVVLQDNNVPTLSATVQGDLTCDVAAVIIDGSASASSGTGTLTYEWLDPNGTVVGTSPTISATMEGAYTLTITDSDNMCSSINNALTVVSNTSEPTAAIDDLNGSFILCDLPNLVFDGSSSSSANAATLSYAWTLNGNPLGTTPNIEAGEAGTLVLTVTDMENGCSSDASVTIELDANLPMVNIASNAAAITCDNNAVTIDASASTAGLEYLWTGPGNITDETTLTPTVDAAGQYTLTITNTGNGCTSSASTTITSDTNPPAVAANAMNQFNCVTTEVTLSGDGSAIGSDFSYDWTTANGVIASGSTTLTPVISAPGTYTLEVTNNLTGCTNTSDVVVGADNDVPTISSFVTDEPTCFGDTDGSLAIESVTGGEAPYLYSIDGGNTFTTVDQFSFLGAGEYTVMVQDLNGCESTEVVTLDQPGELLVELGEDLTIQLGDSYVLDPQIIGGYDVLTWSNCDSDTCQVATQDIQPLETSQYAITLVDGNGCTATDMITILVEKKRDVFIPNVFTPNGDGQNDFFLPFAGQEVSKIHEFRIFSRWGAEIYQKLDFDPRTTPQEDGWDGRFNAQAMNPQVFVYYVDVEFIDGRREVLRGDVALRR